MKHRLLSCLLLAALLLTGCQQAQLPEEEQESTTLVEVPEEPEEAPAEQPSQPKQLALPYAPDSTLDPVTCPDGIQQVVSSLLYEGLFHLNRELEPEPLLCSSYTYDPAALQYTFTLREGVSFSDGSPLAATDVRATLERARTSSRYQRRLAGISGISAPNDTTVIIKLFAPNTALPALLDIPIVKTSTAHDDVPLGTGPYFLSQEETGTYLIASQTWWQSESHPTERIALVESSGSALYRFTSQDVHLLTADLVGASPISVTGAVRCLDADSTTLQYLVCNTAAAPLNDPALRRALSRCIDREHLVSAYLAGHGRATQFPVSPVSPLYPADLDFPVDTTPLETPPERTLTLLLNEGNEFKRAAAQDLADSFGRIGVKTELRILPWEEYVAALAAGNFDLCYCELRLTADWNLSSLLGTGGALNYGGFSNPTTDTLLASYRAAEVPETAMHSLCTSLAAQAPIIPLCFKSVSVLIQPDVIKALNPTAAEPFYDLASVRLSGT